MSSISHRQHFLIILFTSCLSFAIQYSDLIQAIINLTPSDICCKWASSINFSASTDFFLVTILGNHLVYSRDIGKYLICSFGDLNFLSYSWVFVFFYWLCSLSITKLFWSKTSSVVSSPALLTFLQFFMKWFTQLKILSVLFKINLHNKLLTKVWKMVVVATIHFISFLSPFTSDSSLLVIAGCSGQCLLSPNHSGLWHQKPKSLLSWQPLLPKLAGLLLVGT